MTIHAAKTNLSKLINRACAGEEVVIARGKTPVVRLVPVEAEKPRRKIGAKKGGVRPSRDDVDPFPGGESDFWERAARLREEFSSRSFGDTTMTIRRERDRRSARR